ERITQVGKPVHVVSGGAAWADHLAVVMFLMGHAKKLTLHLPAPFCADGRFVGPEGRSSASVANYYHEKFSKIVGFDSMKQIVEVAGNENCDGTSEAPTADFIGMRLRNFKVA